MAYLRPLLILSSHLKWLTPPVATHRGYPLFKSSRPVTGTYIKISVNWFQVDGLGSTSTSVLYAALVVSSMFVPTLLIKKLTVKWAMVVSIFCYSTYIAAQFHPEFYTLVPGAIILGIGAAPMWSAQCTYLSQIGNIYGELTNQPVEPILVKFFGIFFFFFQSNRIWGNLISSAGKVLCLKSLKAP